MATLKDDVAWKSNLTFNGLRETNMNKLLVYRRSRPRLLS